jgi:hypothetical protein
MRTAGATIALSIAPRYLVCDFDSNAISAGDVRELLSRFTAPDAFLGGSDAVREAG